MTDFVELAERLEDQASSVLDPGYPYFGTPELVREAAAGLRAQRAEIERLRLVTDHWQKRFSKAQAETERLRELLQQCRPYIARHHDPAGYPGGCQACALEAAINEASPK